MEQDYSVYDEILAALGDDSWERIPTDESRLLAVDALKAQTGEDVEVKLDEALSHRPDEAEICILDLRPAAVRDDSTTVFPRTFARIANHLRQKHEAGGLQGHLVVVVPHLDDRNDVPWSQFWKLADEKDELLTIVDERGTVWSKRFVGADESRIRSALTGGLAEARERLRRKMIRQLGIFPNPAEGDAAETFSRYYFNGRYCKGELEELITDRASKVFEKGSSNAIVFAAGVADWLAGPISAAQENLEATKNFDAVVQHSIEQLQAGEELRDGAGVVRVLAIVPMFDSGDSLKALIREAWKWAPAAKVTGLCVLRQGAPDSHPTSLDGKSVTTHHLHGIVQKGVNRSELDVPYNRADPDCSDRFLAFTSRDFWELAHEAPFIGERNPPIGRHPLRRVPDLHAFLDNGGAWIAHKIEWAIETHVEGRRAQDLGLVMVAEEKAAERLSSILEETLGNTPLHVPRDRLLEWDDGSPAGKTKYDGWLNARETWLMALSSAHQHMVIIDEFCYSGGTVRGLASLLEHTGRQVRLIVVLASFSRKTLNEAVPDHPVVALYSTEWREPAAVVARIEDPDARTA